MKQTLVKSYVLVKTSLYIHSDCLGSSLLFAQKHWVLQFLWIKIEDPDQVVISRLS